ncbi:MAG: alpha-glucosidase/alpha-galactosidase [Spirochaetaceae bacterium]|jgi:alpha-galactosidase|nr:alpha-glucosidase/alpha-galactosidase [Spirochaetaceae bacterium]
MNTVLDRIKICYIGGGSRNWAWVLIQDLAFEKEIAGTIHLYDLKESAARDNEIIGNRVMAENNRGRWTFSAGPSLEDALIGSDFVFISILPGDFEEMAVDVHEPEKYGIYQSVGDTAGPGGLMRALRTIPQFREIARAIKTWAPDAWVLNYTNPMSVCTRTLYREFPEIKAFGCCHEVFNTQKLLRTVLEEAGAAAGTINREEIKTRVLGINHFTWIDRASWKNIDIVPYYAEFAEKYADKGFEAPGEKNWENDYFSSAERVKLDLFRRYGLIAAAGDRHLAEFCPRSWYLANPEQVREWKFSLTPVSYRIENRKKLEAKAAAYRDGKEKLLPVHSGEEGLRIMKALLGLGNLVTNVNLPNKGQMPDFPLGPVVETNAEFSRDNIQPLVSDGLPGDIRNLTLHHLYNQEGIVEAAFGEDREKAFRVFLNDPSIQTLCRDQARELFASMTAKTLPPRHFALGG